MNFDRNAIDSPEPIRRRDLAILFGVALVARLTVWFVRRDSPLSLDSVEYLASATAILDGAPWPNVWRPPGWPLVLAGTLAATARLPVLCVVLNVLLSSAVVPVVARVAATILPRKRALFAGLVVALHPSLLYLTPALLSEPLSWILLAILASLLARRESTPVVSLGLGALAAELWLVRAAFLVLLPLVFFAPMQTSVVRRLRHSALALGGAFVVIATSMAFVNWRTGLSGSAPGAAEHMFWMGAHPSRLVPEREIPRFVDANGRAVDGQISAEEFRRAGWSDLRKLARESPLAFLAFPFRKIWALHELTSSGTMRGFALASHLPVTLLALAGAIALFTSPNAGSRWAAGMIVATAACLALPPLLTMPWTRYYSPLVPVLAPLVAAVGFRERTSR